MITIHHKWKRRVLWSGAVFLVAAGILASLVFSRFHFINQSFPTLAWLQGNQHVVSSPKLDRLLIGHRGSLRKSTQRGVFIGNTASSIRHAVVSGLDWIEVDVRRTKDGHLVVFHDETIDRKTTGSGPIAALELADLKAVDLRLEPVEKILTLDEVFEQFHSSKRHWVLDIKARGMKHEVLQFVRKRLQKDQFVLFGTYDVLKEYEGSGYVLGMTAVWKSNHLRALFAPSQIVRRCKDIDCEYLVLSAVFATQSLIDRAKAEDIRLLIYGTDNAMDLQQLARRGVDGFIIDHP